MTTVYPGREDEHDLGDGHSFTWMSDQTDTIIGLIEHHSATAENEVRGHKYCGGYIAWMTPPDGSVTASRHQLVAGGPGDEGSLTVAPSLACRSCPSHGFIRNGIWVPA
jgi:hypothetical protein